MNLSHKTKNFITILGAVVGIVGIALTGINIGRSIGSEKQQLQHIQQVIIKGNVTVDNDGKIIEVTNEN
ncbi:hypothetical protein LZ906_017850 (plasmid) [Paraclostridium ghonii]|uniref:hypothetical protein n=1 Tax=Paraclostridium ghonii TaxID=29358 RepID=UPI00202CEA1D|nr:hypothetical protein [Paeniclostridium ghonii]MCM0167410.1 hypothetical protein [Paeniclostridium ghonii]